MAIRTLWIRIGPAGTLTTPNPQPEAEKQVSQHESALGSLVISSSLPSAERPPPIIPVVWAHRVAMASSAGSRRHRNHGVCFGHADSLRDYVCCRGRRGL